MPGDVFEEDPAGRGFVNDAGDVGPQVPLVACAFSLTGVRKRLARIARENDIHGSTPCPPVECCKIAPDWGWGEVSGSLGCDEGVLRVFLPLDKASGVEARLCEHEAHVETAGAGAETEAAEGSGMYAHVTPPPPPPRSRP